MSRDRFEETKVRNFYYLLAYAFNDEKIEFKDSEKFGSESMDNIYDLFSIVLYIRLKELLQEGIYNEYIELTDDLHYVKGSIDLINTVRTNLLKTKNKIICNYEEYSENNYINQIIKTTIHHLLHCNIINNNRIRLRQIYYTFYNIDYIKDIEHINWKDIQFNKLNNKYEVIIKICKFVLNELIMNNENDENKLTKVDDNQAYHTLFEKFIRNYFKIYFSKHFMGEKISIKSKKMNWDIDEQENNTYIPKMHTDISISKGSKTKIIDAKFYSHILNEKGFNGQKAITISSNNWYQLFSYIINEKWNIEKTNNTPIISGMLIYASTGEDFDKFKTKIHGMNMEVYTIDFRKKFGKEGKDENNNETIVGQMSVLAKKIYEDIK